MSLVQFPTGGSNLTNDIITLIPVSEAIALAEELESYAPEAQKEANEIRRALRMQENDQCALGMFFLIKLEGTLYTLRENARKARADSSK